MLSSIRSTRLTNTQRLSAAGVAVTGAAALTVSLVPGVASGAEGKPQEAKPEIVQSQVATHGTTHSVSSQDGLLPAQRSGPDQLANVVGQQAIGGSGAQQQAAAKKAKAEKAEKAEKKAKQERAAKAAASRKAQRAAVKQYPNNLDGWIREARAIMKSEGIPGSYNGIKRNIMRESGGDPKAMNDWDINAQKGTPSKGLLQVIQPTFDHYHVKGTKKDLNDPVANITAACNYAADRYGSMDNVDSAY